MKPKVDQKLTDALKHVLGSADGRLFVRWLLFDLCKLIEGSFHTNALVNAHLTGRQAVGKELFLLLQVVAPESLILLLREHILASKNADEEKNDLAVLEEELTKGLYDEH